MTSLPAVRNSSPLKSEGKLTPEEMEKFLSQFEALLDEALASGNTAAMERLQERIEMLRARMLRDTGVPQSSIIDGRALPSGSEPPAPPVSVSGNVGPGAALDGTVVARQIAGEKIITTSTYIDKYIDESGRHAELILNAKDSHSAERMYLLRLLSTVNRVPLGQLEIRAAGATESMPEIHLEQIFVPLDTTQTQPAMGSGKSGARVPITAMAAVISHRRLVVLGDPGSGKTSFVNYLTYSLAQSCLDSQRFPVDRLSVTAANGQRAANWKYGVLLPVRIDLREFAQHLPAERCNGTCELVWKFLVDHLTTHGLGDFVQTLKSRLQQGKCLIMFDGLDEVSDLPRRTIVRDAVTDFADTYTEARMIVTCRMLSYTDPAWRLTSFPEVTLAPLSEASVNTFIESWYGTLAYLGYLERGHAVAKAAQLRRAATRLYDLAQNPMLLTVMAVVHTYKGTLPRERARLYNDCVELLLWNWQRHKQTGTGSWEAGILQELNTREERLVNGLCEVAFHAHQTQGSASGTANISETDVVRILRNYLDKDFGRAQIFCKYVEKEAGLLIGKGTDAGGERLFAFPHRGFQEFLAARHLVSGHDLSRRLKDLAAQGDIWREVLMLTIGHLVFNQQEVSRPLDAINLLCPVEIPTSEAGWRAVWWAGEMLHIVGRSPAEGDEHVGRQLIPRLIGHLAALVSGGHLTAVERAQAGDVLGGLGDNRPGVCTVVPEMVRIEVASVEIGADGERHQVTLKPFMLARYPITNAQFRVFVENGGYLKKQFWTAQGWEWSQRTEQRRGMLDDPVWGIDNRPAVGLTWYEAVAYTRWLSAQQGQPVRLPTEAEWEAAAAGSEGRKYPWGSRTSDDTANHRDTGIGQSTAVGIFPSDRTPEGVYDLGGNIWEWCSSLAVKYRYCPTDGREDMNKVGPRILRGGSFESPRPDLHCSIRHHAEPHARVQLIGFRIASDIK